MTQARIMIVEDEVLVAERIRGHLVKLGYEVVAMVAFGEEAADVAAESRPDLVLMDISLAGEMDGVQAAEQIRRQFDIPVIYLTAHADEATLQRAKVSEPFGYILKPFRTADLPAPIEMALYKHRTETKLAESEKRLRAILEAAPAAVVIVDGEGQIVLVNARTESMFGYHRQELLGQAVEILLPDRVRSSHELHRAGYLADPHMRPMGIGLELAGRRKDGAEFPVEVGLSYAETQDGILVTSFVTDISERRQAEQLLRVKDSALESSINAMAMADLEGKLTYVNDAFLKMWGYDSKEEVLGRPIVDFWQDQDAAAKIIGVLMAEDRWVGELVARRKDGERFDSLISASMVYDDAGEPICMMSSFLDITDSKRAEQEIEWLARFPGENPAPVLRFSRDGQVIYANRASGPLLDAWQCQVDAYLPDDWRSFVSYIFASGVPQAAEVELDDLTLSLNFAPVLDAGYVNVYGLDITARKQTEEQLRKLSRAIEQSPSTVVITDMEGAIEYVNPKFTQVTGYQPNEVIGENPRILQSGVQSAEFYEQLWSTLAAGGEWKGEFSNRKKNGEVYWESASISPIRNAAGVTTHYLKVSEDITARKLAEEALHQRTAELQVRNEELDAFAHTVAHDLQNPLNLVMGFADLLEETYDELDGEEVQGYLRYIARSSRKMSSIISELLLLAASRKSDVEVSPLDMGEIVGEALHRLEDMIESSGAEIVTPSTWPVVMGYGPWIEEVWVNYLSNAIKYGGKPPRVELGADLLDAPGPAARFWVRDNGRGLTPEEQDRLFVPFTRLAQVRAEGHGLGLSIVRRIVKKLDGQVGVESEGAPGQGSVFSFTLPMG